MDTRQSAKVLHKNQAFTDRLIISCLILSEWTNQQAGHGKSLEERRTLKVLIADDSALVRERLVGMLSQLEQVEIIGQARDGLEAIDSIRKLSPDVVLLDIRMPKSSGINVLESINTDACHPIVVVMTNYTYPQYRRKCIEAGAHFFFDKSTEFDKIPAVLKRLILGTNIWQDCCLFE